MVRFFREVVYCVILTFLALFSYPAYAEVLYDNTSTISLGGTASVTITQSLASKITSGSQSKIIDSFLVSMNLRTSGTGLAGQVCPDNGAGTAPGAPCSSFSATALPTGSFAYITFTGSYNLPANSTYWVVVRTSGPGTYRLQIGNLATNIGYISTNSGATWSSFFSFPLQVLGSNAFVAPTPSAVPTLSEWSQLLLGLLVMTMIGWHFHKQRSY